MVRRKKNKKITLEELKRKIYSIPVPKDWREGQFVFNRVEQLYGNVAREVQFLDNVDCFHVNEKIDEFLEKVYLRLKK